MNYFYMIILALFLYVGTVYYIKNYEEERINNKLNQIIEDLHFKQEWEKII